MHTHLGSRYRESSGQHRKGVSALEKGKAQRINGNRSSRMIRALLVYGLHGRNAVMEGPGGALEGKIGTLYVYIHTRQSGCPVESALIGSSCNTITRESKHPTLLLHFGRRAGTVTGQ